MPGRPQSEYVLVQEEHFGHGIPTRMAPYLCHCPSVPFLFSPHILCLRAQKDVGEVTGASTSQQTQEPVCERICVHCGISLSVCSLPPVAQSFNGKRGKVLREAEAKQWPQKILPMLHAQRGGLHTV